MISAYKRKCKLHVEVTSKVEGKWSALWAKHFTPSEGGPLSTEQEAEYVWQLVWCFGEQNLSSTCQKSNHSSLIIHAQA